MKKEYDFSNAKGVVLQKGKTRISIYLDDDILAGIPAPGGGSREGIPDNDQ